MDSAASRWPTAPWLGSAASISMRRCKRKKTATPLLAPLRLWDSHAPNYWAKRWAPSPAMSLATSTRCGTTWDERCSLPDSSAGDGARALEYVAALENYTRAERLPWSDLFATRGRLLAGAAQGSVDDGMRDELVRIRTTLRDAGLRAFLPPIEAALAT